MVELTLTLLLILLSAFLPNPVLADYVYNTTTCSESRDLVLTDTFVDIYNAYAYYVVATPDGGAVYASRDNSQGGLRVVKVDSKAKFQWFTERKAEGDDGWDFLGGLVLDCCSESEPFLYLGGYTTANGISAYIIKYRLADGSYVNSSLAKKHLGVRRAHRELLASHWDKRGHDRGGRRELRFGGGKLHRPAVGGHGRQNDLGRPVGIRQRVLFSIKAGQAVRAQLGDLCAGYRIQLHKALRDR